MDGNNTSIITIAVGLYLGMAIAQFFTAITRDLLTPIFSGIFPGAQKTADAVVIQIGSVKLSIGDAIAALFNLAIAYGIVNLTLPYLRSYAPVGGRR